MDHQRSSERERRRDIAREESRVANANGVRSPARRHSAPKDDFDDALLPSFGTAISGCCKDTRALGRNHETSTRTMVETITNSPPSPAS